MRLRASAIGALLLLASQSGIARADEAATRQIEAFNRKILLREIELERYSIHFREKNNVQGRWRGWRYFLTQEAGAACTAGGLTAIIAERQRIINVPNALGFTKDGKLTAVQRNPNRAKIESGITPQMVGQFIAAGGSLTELGINYYHGHQAKKAGYSPKEGIKKVTAIRDDINELFRQRQALVESSSLTAKERAIADCEQDVLRDLTNMGLFEYCDFHAGARRFRAMQDSLYAFDIAKSITGAAGNIAALESQHRPAPRLGGTGGILTTISGVLIMVGPVASRGIGRLVEHHHRKKLATIVSGTEKTAIAKLEADRLRLEHLIKDHPDRDEKVCSAEVLTMLSSCEHEAEMKQEQFDLATRDIRAGTRSATQNITVGAIVGGTKVAFGVGSIIGGFRYHDFPHKNNSIAQAGTIAYCAGSYLSVGDNIRLRVLDEYNRYKLGKERKLPMQVLGDRLVALDKIEKSLAIASE